MKKYLIMAAAAMLLLASCEKNEPAAGSFELSVGESQILNDTTIRISEIEDNYGLEMKMDGTIAPVDGLTAYTVTIQRPTADCPDNFCGNQCVMSNDSLEQTIKMSLSSDSQWSAHYMPESMEAAASPVTITYIFKGGKRTLKLTAIYQTEEN